MNSSPKLHTFSDIFYSSEEDTSRPSSPPSTFHQSSPSNPSPLPLSSPSSLLSPASISPPSSPPSTSTRSKINPDITRLQTTHQTAGYRDGISGSKTSFLQRGFDEGYALGAELGVRVGYILGVLEGLQAGGGGADGGATSPPSAPGAAGNGSMMMKKVLGEARRDLVVERVFGRVWWGEDGVWKFEVGEEGGGGREGEVTFAMVAEGHPLLKRWVERVRAEMGRLGVREGGFEGEEWERGRVGEGEGEEEGEGGV